MKPSLGVIKSRSGYMFRFSEKSMFFCLKNKSWFFVYALAESSGVKNLRCQLCRQVVEPRFLSHPTRILVAVSTELSRVPFTKAVRNITPKLHTLSILARSVSLFPTLGALRALYQ